MSALRKTALPPTSLRRSAIPASESRTFLQIYQLTAERKRLERSIHEWRLRLEEAESNLDKINTRIEELQEQTEPLRLTTRPKRILKGTKGSMILEY
jgi:chromosome segregation ATPase